MRAPPGRAGTGLIIGKFMPPHAGHALAIDFAQRFASALVVLVCELPGQPIPGALRCAWLRREFPGVEVALLTEDNPELPGDHPEFWSIWRDSLRRRLPALPELVFASEDYGARLARVLGATFIPTPGGRELVPVCASAIRADPLAHWELILPSARPYYLRRVCVFGPESTGKTTLARELAEHYSTLHATEYARPLLDLAQGRCEYADIERIARGQIAQEDALAERANRVLFCDTDLLTTVIWSELLFGDCPAWIQEEAEQRRYDTYLLADVDVPWVGDAQRHLPHRRGEFLARCVAELEARGRRYVRISGPWPERFATARAAVDPLLQS